MSLYANSQLPALRSGLGYPALQPPFAPTPRPTRRQPPPAPPGPRHRPPSTAYTSAAPGSQLPPQPPLHHMHQMPQRPALAPPTALHGVLRQMWQHPQFSVPGGARPPAPMRLSSPAPAAARLRPADSSSACYAGPPPPYQPRLPAQPHPPGPAPSVAPVAVGGRGGRLPGEFIPFHAGASPVPARQPRKGHPLFPFWCETCARHFRSQAALEEHVERHQVCTWPKCSFVCGSVERMQQHIDLHITCDGFTSIDTKKYIEQRRQHFPIRGKAPDVPNPEPLDPLEETQGLVQRSMAALEGSLKRKRTPTKIEPYSTRRGTHLMFADSDEEDSQPDGTHPGSPTAKRPRPSPAPADSVDDDAVLLAVLRLVVGSDFLQRPLPRRPEPPAVPSLFDADLAILTRLARPPPPAAPKPGDSLRALRHDAAFLLKRLRAKAPRPPPAEAALPPGEGGPAPA